jgi:hypothetical protein
MPMSVPGPSVNGGMGLMYLVNDDQPSQFRARRLSIVRDDVRLADKPGLIVNIEPAIENAAGGPLATALLIARHGEVDIDALRRGQIDGPASVFVCRLRSEPTEALETLAPDSVSVVFWGRVTSTD